MRKPSAEVHIVWVSFGGDCDSESATTKKVKRTQLVKTGRGGKAKTRRTLATTVDDAPENRRKGNSRRSCLFSVRAWARLQRFKSSTHTHTQNRQHRVAFIEIFILDFRSRLFIYIFFLVRQHSTQHSLAGFATTGTGCCLPSVAYSI